MQKRLFESRHEFSSKKITFSFYPVVAGRHTVSVFHPVLFYIPSNKAAYAAAVSVCVGVGNYLL